MKVVCADRQFACDCDSTWYIAGASKVECSLSSSDSRGALMS